MALTMKRSLASMSQELAATTDPSELMTDALFVFKHSSRGDREIRYALRGISENAPFIRKVWIFGDRPDFIGNDTKLIEHVPHEYVARIGDFRTPIRNTFLMVFLGSILPELTSEFVLFNDDFILLRTLTRADLLTQRYVENMADSKSRGRGLFKDALWRTHDILKRFDYSVLNFENHVPTLLTKRQVLDAYLHFEDFITEDRYGGLLAQTTILNYALKSQAFPTIHLGQEGRHTGFHFREFSYEDIAVKCYGKTFLNFDDEAFNPAMLQFLSERFPDPCQFEQVDHS